MRGWQKELNRELNREANEPCTCTNNGDYCKRCDARLQLAELSKGRSLTVAETREIARTSAEESR